MLSCIAIDDEPLALELIKGHCKKNDFVDLKKTFLSSTDGLNYLSNETIDVIILDINMPTINGIDLSKLLPRDIQIIFITAYEKYALKSYDVNTTDYIVKPASFDRLYKALLKCKNKKELLIKKPKTNQTNNHFIIVKDGKTIHQVLIEEILFIEGLKD